MPCSAPVRGKTDIYYPWDPDINNDPCGMKLLTSVSGVDVSAENLCRFHWVQKHGGRDLQPDFAKAVAADAPIVWLKQDEASGLVAADAMGGPNWAYGAGVIKGQPSLYGGGGYSAIYPTTTDLASIGDSVLLSVTGAITLEAWFKILTLPAPGGPSTIYIIQKGSGYQLRLDDFGSGPVASVFFWNPAVVVKGCSTPPSFKYAIGQVWHIVGTWDLSTIRLYMNGVEVSNAAWIGDTIVDNAGAVGIGPGPIQLDDCAIYNKALSAARVLAHYQAATGALVTEP